MSAISSALVWIFLLVLAVILKLLPALAAHEGDKQISCRANLKNIGIALVWYTMDHDEKLPPDLQTLAGEMQLVLPLFVCPGTARKAGVLSNLNEWTDYTYVAGPDTREDARSVIVFCRPVNHRKKGAFALFADWRVEWMPTEQFVAFTNTPPSFFGTTNEASLKGLRIPDAERERMR